MFGLGYAGRQMREVTLVSCPTDPGVLAAHCPFSWAHSSRQGLLSAQDDTVLCCLAPMLTPALPGGRRNLVLPSLEALNNCWCPASPVLLWGLVKEHKTLLQGQGLGLSPCPHGC